MDKAIKTSEEIVAFGQGNIEAFIKSSQIWTAGVQDLSKQVAATTQAHFDETMANVKALSSGERVTKVNALFHWAVPPGREMDAGREVGRHFIMTHAYWREGGPEFRDVNVMGVAHGTDKAMVLAHKAAIDRHLEEAGIVVGYTNVFWGGRSEIKPSEISPSAYAGWCRSIGIDPATMRE